jgi:hypothetical protein
MSQALSYEEDAMDVRMVGTVVDPTERALAAHETIASLLREVRRLVKVRGEALRAAHAAAVSWAALARRFGVTPSRIIELSRR